MKKAILMTLALGLTAVVCAQANYAERVNTLIGTKGVGLTSGYLYPGKAHGYHGTICLTELHCNTPPPHVPTVSGEHG